MQTSHVSVPEIVAGRAKLPIRLRCTKCGKFARHHYLKMTQIASVDTPMSTEVTMLGSSFCCNALVRMDDGHDLKLRRMEASEEIYNEYISTRYLEFEYITY